MGRGDRTSQAAKTAQNLLFGSRSPRTTDPQIVNQRKKEMAKVGRSRARVSRQEDYYQAILSLGECFENETVEPIRDWLASSTPGGLKAVEKKALRELIKQMDLSWMTAKYCDPLPVDYLVTAGNTDNVDLLLGLRQRLLDNKMPQTVINSLGADIIERVVYYTNEQIRQEIASMNPDMDPIPEAGAGDDYRIHLLKDSNPWCQKANANKHSEHFLQFNGPLRKYSILADRIKCPHCIEKYKSAKGEGPDVFDHKELVTIFSNQKETLPGRPIHNDWNPDLSIARWGHWGIRIGDATGQEIIDDHLQNMREGINNNLKVFALPPIFS